MKEYEVYHNFPEARSYIKKNGKKVFPRDKKYARYNLRDGIHETSFPLIKREENFVIKSC